MRSRCLAAAALLACAPVRSPPAHPDGPEGTGVERVGDVAVLPLGGAAFNRLPRQQKVLAFHLAQAAMAAHPVVLLQNYRHDLAIWELVDGLAARVDLLDPGFAPRLLEYRRRIFLHRGIHDAWTQVKFVPDFDFQELGGR